jgi:predicted transport protein
VLHLNVKFSSLKEQALFYGDIPHDDPIGYHDVDVGQESPEELADVIGVFSRALSKQVCPGMVHRVYDSW